MYWQLENVLQPGCGQAKHALAHNWPRCEKQYKRCVHLSVRDLQAFLLGSVASSSAAEAHWPCSQRVRVFSASEQYVRYIWVNICYPCRPMLWPHSPGARETVCKTRNAKGMGYNHMKTWSLLEIKTIIRGLILHFILSPKCSYFVSIISVIIDNKHRSFLLHFLLFLLAQTSSLLMPELTSLQDLVDFWFSIPQLKDMGLHLK